MATIGEPISAAELFVRSLDATSVAMSPDTAKYVLSLRLPAEDERRLEELAEKSRAGTLTTTEQRLLEEYVHFGKMMEILRLRAKLALRDPTT